MTSKIWEVGKKFSVVKTISFYLHVFVSLT